VLVQTVFDRGRRELWCVALLATALVMLRSAPFLLFPYIDFDSDQAILGLMAKHLSELRTFPLFYYGQNYMLGATAWVIAPLFWMGRPSVAVMKLPLLVANVAVAVVLIRLLVANLRLRPAIAFLATLPFVVPPPVISGIFLQGVEPILYVLILWAIRRRPIAFGALLAFGFVHREFTIYALPALALVSLPAGTLWSEGAVERYTRAIGGFAIIWLIIDAAKRFLNGNSLTLQAQQLGNVLCLNGPRFPDRIRFVLTEVWPLVVGGTANPLDHYAMRSSAVVGSPMIGGIATAAMIAMTVRLAWLWRSKSPSESSVAFAVYLALIGCCALAAYTLTCAFSFPVVRYVYLAVLLPVGCFAALMALEPSKWVQTAAIAIFALCATANLADNVRVLREAYVNPQPNPHGELTEFLLSHQIRYARAGYWDSYIVDFLSGERVIVASTGPVRIPEYQQRVDENREDAVTIQRMPCDGQWRVAAWCIQLPVRADQGAR
jgi:hypothetical protein